MYSFVGTSSVTATCGSFRMIVDSGFLVLSSSQLRAFRAVFEGMTLFGCRLADSWLHFHSRGKKCGGSKGDLR